LQGAEGIAGQRTNYLKIDRATGWGEMWLESRGGGRWSSIQLSHRAALSDEVSEAPQLPPALYHAPFPRWRTFRPGLFHSI